jgi:catechol 2,3-dioxygenase-like lactoylglutathione lyase family enzyme
MQLLSAIPALPVHDVEKSIPFYRDVLGLIMRHQDHGFAIFHRDAVEVHYGRRMMKVGKPVPLRTPSVQGQNPLSPGRRVVGLQ